MDVKLFKDVDVEIVILVVNLRCLVVDLVLAIHNLDDIVLVVLIGIH